MLMKTNGAMVVLLDPTNCTNTNKKIREKMKIQNKWNTHAGGGHKGAEGPLS